MKAMDATTYTELQEFTKDLESRPTERMLRDIADLVNTSESKAHIVGYVLAVKYRNATKPERSRILHHLDHVSAGLPPGEQRERVAAIATRIRTHEGT